MLQMTNDRNPLHHDFSVDSVRFRLSALCLVLHLHNEAMSLISYFLAFLASLASLALHIKLKWRNENTKHIFVVRMDFEFEELDGICLSPP